jgi:hypothetical protein
VHLQGVENLRVIVEASWQARQREQRPMLSVEATGLVNELLLHPERDPGEVHERPVMNASDARSMGRLWWPATVWTAWSSLELGLSRTA